MAKIITSDFGKIHDALNKMIIEQVKSALKYVPYMEVEGKSLCRIVVSDGADYAPKDVSVDKVWIDPVGDFHFIGHLTMPDYADPNDEPETFRGGEAENTDWLDITDFQYLIEQMKDKMRVGEDDGYVQLRDWQYIYLLKETAEDKIKY